MINHGITVIIGEEEQWYLSVDRGVASLSSAPHRVTAAKTEEEYQVLASYAHKLIQTATIECTVRPFGPLV